MELVHSHAQFEELKERLKKKDCLIKIIKKKYQNTRKNWGGYRPNRCAIRDIITTIKRRYPICEILVFSTLVQGQNWLILKSSKQIKNPQKYDLDTLIVGRGGGEALKIYGHSMRKSLQEQYSNAKPP